MEMMADDISVTIDDRLVVPEVSVTAPAGAITALVGPSGCGKTTVLHCLGLLQRPTSGKILVDGQDSSGWGEKRRAEFWRESASFVLQDYGVMDEETIEFNVVMQPSLLRRRPAEQAKLQSALERTGLDGRARERASHLSGGKATAFDCPCSLPGAAVIFADEPTASLDRRNRSEVIKLFTEFARAGGTVLVASHDSDMISASDWQQPIGARRERRVK